MSQDDNRKPHQKAVSAVYCAMDSLERINGILTYGNISPEDMRYAAQQIALALAYASQARELLENELARIGMENFAELQRKRLSDRSYTPSINEVSEDPDSFIDGL